MMNNDTQPPTKPTTTKEVFDKFLKELEEGKVKGGVVYWPTAPKLD